MFRIQKGGGVRVGVGVQPTFVHEWSTSIPLFISPSKDDPWAETLKHALV